MKILYLTVTNHWFDQIESGGKREEYREIKDYWTKRLCDPISFKFKEYDAVHFRAGYSKNSRTMLVECLSLREGKGDIHFGASGGHQYIIKLGQKIK